MAEFAFVVGVHGDGVHARDCNVGEGRSPPDIVGGGALCRVLGCIGLRHRERHSIEPGLFRPREREAAFVKEVGATQPAHEAVDVGRVDGGEHFANSSRSGLGSPPR